MDNKHTYGDLFISSEQAAKSLGISTRMLLYLDKVGMIESTENGYKIRDLVELSRMLWNDKKKHTVKVYMNTPAQVHRFIVWNKSKVWIDLSQDIPSEYQL